MKNKTLIILMAVFGLTAMIGLGWLLYFGNQYLSVKNDFDSQAALVDTLKKQINDLNAKLSGYQGIFAERETLFSKLPNLGEVPRWLVEVEKIAKASGLKFNSIFAMAADSAVTIPTISDGAIKKIDFTLLLDKQDFAAISKFAADLANLKDFAGLTVVAAPELSSARTTLSIHYLDSK